MPYPVRCGAFPARRLRKSTRRIWVWTCRMGACGRLWSWRSSYSTPPATFLSIRGGFVLTEDRLDELVPIEPAAMENRQIIEWDQGAIDESSTSSLEVNSVSVSADGVIENRARSIHVSLRHMAPQVMINLERPNGESSSTPTRL